MPNEQEHKQVSLPLRVKLTVSLAILLVFCLHLFLKTDLVDGTAALLLAVAILPWLSDLLDTLELPGGWKLHFRNLEEEQTKQRRQLEQLQLATRLLLTDAEMQHLKRFAGAAPMPLHRDYTTPFYEKELRRLKALGLIEGSVGDFLRKGDDARAHLKITLEGAKYLEFRAEQIKDVNAAA